MNQDEYIRTRAQRELILQEVLASYIPRRVDGLSGGLPLELFAPYLKMPTLAERRDRFVNEINNLEDSLLVGGCQPYETLRFAYRQIVPITGMVDKHFRESPPKMEILKMMPIDLARKAEEALYANPHYRHDGL